MELVVSGLLLSIDIFRCKNLVRNIREVRKIVFFMTKITNMAAEYKRKKNDNVMEIQAYFTKNNRQRLKIKDGNKPTPSTIM